VAGNRKPGRPGTDKEIAKEVACVDDVPSVARMAARQQFFAKWYRLLALVPFAAILFIAFEFFPNPNSWTQVVLVFVAIIWGGSVAGYAFYLMFAVRCPECRSRFGLGEKCRSCGLPRHRDSRPAVEGTNPPS
jgi:hypothetical protein